MDTGAEWTLVRLDLANDFCSFVAILFRPKKSGHIFRFGEDREDSIGYISIRISIGVDEIIIHWVNILNLITSFIVSLDTLTKLEMDVDTVHERLRLP